MANTKSQRVAAFLLALLFLATTLGSAGYVVWELLREDENASQVTDLESIEEVDQTTTQPESEADVADDTQKTTIDNFTGPQEVAELRFEDLVAGDGEAVQPSDTVTIHYTGALASDGSIFDSSVGGDPATFGLDQLIAGWQQGIPGMKVGGTRRLYIPSDLGYGERGSGASIPPNSDLIFDIELFATER